MPPLGVLVLPFVAQPVLLFSLKYGIGGGLAVLGIAFLVFIIIAEELALIYALFAVMTALLLALLGRIRAIEYLVCSIAVAMLSMTAGLAYYFFGSWATMFRDLRASLTQQLAAALTVQEKMGLPQDSLAMIKEQVAHFHVPAQFLLSGILVILVFITSSLCCRLDFVLC